MSKFFIAHDFRNISNQSVMDLRLISLLSKSNTFVCCCVLCFMRKKVHSVSRIPEVVDLFCGIGGLSYGLKSQGKGGFDLDATCRYAYEYNIGARFFHKNIKDVSKDDVCDLYSKNSIKVLAGCAPCQPFSSYSHKKDKDPDKYDLLYEFGRLVKDVSPDYVTMENVSQIINFKLKPVFPDFLNTLTEEGYHVLQKVRTSQLVTQSEIFRQFVRGKVAFKTLFTALSPYLR